MNAMDAIQDQDRIRGGLLGLLIGDALGVPYEFHPPESIPPLKRIAFTPPKGFSRAHAGVPPGTWSDDGSQALCLLASLLDRGELDLDDFAKRLLDWARDGYMAVDGRVFDIGIATRTALLQRLANRTKPEESGLADENSNGNGSLMRVLPLALWHTGRDEELAADAARQSLVTHRHMRSQVCCALYCLYARRILEGANEPWQNAFETLRSHYTDSSALAELECIAQHDAKGPKGSGYVVDSLVAAKHAWLIPTYTEAVRWAIALGHDTDTTACIVGGIIGLRDGIAGIPKRWTAQLRGRDLYEPLLDRLLHHQRMEYQKRFAWNDDDITIHKVGEDPIAEMMDNDPDMLSDEDALKMALQSLKDREAMLKREASGDSGTGRRRKRG